MLRVQRRAALSAGHRSSGKGRLRMMNRYRPDVIVIKWRYDLKPFLSILLLSVYPAAVGLCAGGSPSASLADLPDPLVGTDSRFELSHGNTYPGVFTPFGMIGWTARTG